MCRDLVMRLPLLDVQKHVFFHSAKSQKKTQTHTGSDRPYPMSSMQEIEDWIEVFIHNIKGNSRDIGAPIPI